MMYTIFSKGKTLLWWLLIATFFISGAYLAIQDFKKFWEGPVKTLERERPTFVTVDSRKFLYKGFIYFWELPDEELHRLSNIQLWYSKTNFTVENTLMPRNKVSHITKEIHSATLSIPPKNAIINILCKLNVDAYCNSYQVADVIDTFWVICPIYAGYQTTIKTRYQTHGYFRDNIQTIGMPFCTLEAIRKDRHQDYLMTQAGKEPYEMQMQIYDDGYLRENLLNVAAKKIKDWEYIAWIDAHHIFENPYWWEEAIVKMEKYASVQLFQRFNGFTKTNQTQLDWLGALYKSFMQFDMDIGLLGFYGNAYSVRREIYEQMGYVYDMCIGGCCDCAYVKASLQKEHKFDYFRQWWKYTNQMDDWIEDTAKVFKASRAVIRGTAFHVPHEETFPYLTILGMFNASDFDKYRDLKKDENGTIMLVNQELKRNVEFWVFLYSFAVPLYVVGIGSGVLVGLFILYKLNKKYKNKHFGFHMTQKSA